MSDPAFKTLFHPFETGMLDMPGPDARVLFIGARAGLRLPTGFSGQVDVIQGFRPDLLALRRAGFNVEPQASQEGYDLALVLGGRHRGQNEAWIADAQRRVRPGGLIVYAASKKEGGDSLRKRAAEVVGIEDYASKDHGIVFWLRNGQAKLDKPSSVRVGRFETRPGMFSHEQPDSGSMLLLDHLPRDLSGKVADFCAGWGYLAGALVDSQAITALDLYEADYAALEAARGGLAGEGERLGFHWLDLAEEVVTVRYDAIVMNPPFHAVGHAADPGIGQRLIRAAARALKPRGRLFMVANRGMPYESVVAGSFAVTGELARDNAFKVLWGQGPRSGNEAKRRT